MTQSSRNVPIIILSLLILVGGWLWLSLRSERLEQTQNLSGQQVQTEPVLTAVEVGSGDSSVRFLASEAELSASVQNQPDFVPLPTKCQPLSGVASYTAISMQQAESVYAWDTAVVTSGNEEKLSKLTSLGSELNSLMELADANTGRLPLRDDWQASTYLPWHDPNCLPTMVSFYPLLIEEVSVAGTDRAWYLELIETPGFVDLPVTRRLVLQKGTRWVMVSELNSATKEVGIAPEVMTERLEKTCLPEQNSQADVVACAAQVWFGEYRKPEVAAEWVSEISSRLEW